MPRWPLPRCLGALARLTPPLRSLASPCIPLRPFTTPQTPSQPLTTPHDPVRSLSPPYRHKGLDCVALEQAIGEGHAAALPPAELVAAEAVLEKARAAEKVKCEKDLREKMKARLLTVAILTMPMLTSHGRRLTLPAQPLGPHCTPLGPTPSLHPLRPLTTAARPHTTLPQAPHCLPSGAAAAGCRQAGPRQGAHARHPVRPPPRATRPGSGQAARSVAAAYLLA